MREFTIGPHKRLYLWTQMKDFVLPVSLYVLFCEEHGQHKLINLNEHATLLEGQKFLLYDLHIYFAIQK